MNVPEIKFYVNAVHRDEDIGGMLYVNIPVSHVLLNVAEWASEERTSIRAAMKDRGLSDHEKEEVEMAADEHDGREPAFNPFFDDDDVKVGLTPIEEGPGYLYRNQWHLSGHDEHGKLLDKGLTRAYACFTNRFGSGLRTVRKGHNVYFPNDEKEKQRLWDQLPVSVQQAYMHTVKAYRKNGHEARMPIADFDKFNFMFYTDGNFRIIKDIQVAGTLI